MQEAFRRALKKRELEKKPDSPIVLAIKGVEQAREPERIKQKEEEQFTQIKEQFKEVGLLWFGTNIDKSTGRSYEHNLIAIEQKKEHYVQALTTLKNRPFQQRIELLRALASGMHLIENHTSPADDSKYGRRFLFAPLMNSSAELSGISFTRPSVFFMEAIGDMSGHSREQQEKFREFMVREAGLKGKVGLPELFPGISRWLDRGFHTSDVREQHKALRHL